MRRRGRGNFVDKQDLVFEFERVAEEVLEQLEDKANEHELTKKDLVTRKALQGKLELLKKDHSRRYSANELQRVFKARFLKPQRVMNLTFQEERARSEATWQDFVFKVV